MRDMAKVEGVPTADFGSFRDDYQFWLQYQPIEQLVASIRRLLPTGGTVLDVGCGDGVLAVALAPLAGHVLGVDLSPTMINAAQQRAQQQGVTNVQFALGDIQQVALPADSFDLVISSFALHHTDLVATLPRLTQAVRPGGWLFMQEPVCPVQGAFRPLWYRWLALRQTLALGQQAGLGAAWPVLRFRQSRAWIDHQLADQHWSLPQWRTTVCHSLPGAVVQAGTSADHVVVLWQRPPAAVIAAPVAVQPSPIVVQRHFPQPAPAAYVPFPREAIEGSVVARFEEQVVHHAHRLALRTSGLTLTYEALNAAANRVAQQVLARSGKAPTPVALLMDQDGPVIPVLLGVLKAGKPYLVIDPADPVERQKRILELAGAEILVTTAATAAQMDMPADLVHNLAHRLVYEEIDGTPTPDNPGLPVTADHLAALFFTSGSTGEPKGVARNHRQFLHSTWLNTNTYFVAPTDRQSLLYFPGFTASVPNIYDTLLNGATLCSLNPRQLAPSVLLDWLRAERITHFNPPIGLWRGLLEAMQPDATWPDLRLVTLAGQPIYGRDVKEFQRHFGQATVLLYVLAMTEAGAVTQGYIDHTTPVTGDGPVPVGYPVADKTVTILDPAGKPVAADEIGQLAITSAYLSLNYWQDEAQTQARFQAVPDDERRRTFLSSDRGVLRPDGGLEYYGRADSIVKVRGYRVDLAAIEATLNSHPLLQQAAVVAHTKSNGEQTLVAYLVSTVDAVDVSGLRHVLAQTLPPYMIPERFVQVPAMPLTASGKIDRAKLTLPKLMRPTLETPFVAPQSALEQQLAALWAELLEVDGVGVTDHFFDLGGDSLLLLRMSLLVEQQLGYTIPAVYYRTPTVRHLAALVQGAAATQDDRIAEAMPATADRPLPAPPATAPHRRLTLWQRGPAYRGRALPYATGTQLQRALLQQPLIQNQFFAQESARFSHYLRTTGLALDPTAALTLHLLANTWTAWRWHALRQPAPFAKWVSMDGTATVRAAVQQGKGLIVVFTHQTLVSQFIRHLLADYGLTDVPVISAKLANPHELTRATLRMQSARQGLELLQRGGAILIAGEGRGATKPLLMPFYGRQLPLPRGFADLAQHSGAAVVAAFLTLDLAGQVRLEFVPLPTPVASQESDDVLLHYGDLLVERWPNVLPTMVWGRVQYLTSLSPVTALAG